MCENNILINNQDKQNNFNNIKKILTNTWNTEIFIDSKNIFMESENNIYPITVNFSTHKFDKLYFGIKMKFKNSEFEKKCKNEKEIYDYIPNSILYSHRQLVIPSYIPNQKILKLAISNDSEHYYLLNYNNIENNTITLYLVDVNNKCKKISNLTLDN